MELEHAVRERIGRWERFLRLDGRQSFLHIVSCTEEMPERPWPRPDNRGARIEWAWRRYQRKLEALAWLEDDSLPFLDPYTGTEIFAEALGCRVTYPEDNMPFALPLVDSAGAAGAVRVPEVSTSSLAALFDIADELRRRAGPTALVRLVDVQSPMDIAALVWDKNTFYTALIDAPEAVLELAGKTRRLLTSFLDQWFARYGRSFIAHYPDYYVPVGLTLSEDEVGAVSPSVFEELFFPELAELSRRYGGLGVHCCAKARHQWAGFARIPGLAMLNICQPAATCDEANRFFAKTCAQMPLPPEQWDLAKGPGQFPADAHVVLQTAVQTREEARRSVELFHRLFR